MPWNGPGKFLALDEGRQKRHCTAHNSEATEQQDATTKASQKIGAIPIGCRKKEQCGYGHKAEYACWNPHGPDPLSPNLYPEQKHGAENDDREDNSKRTVRMISLGCPELLNFHVVSSTREGQHDQRRAIGACDNGT
jgi:hypothetical protein